MESLLPLFPLSIVVFPGEDLNLHIFEPRYIQLINDVYAEKKEFGIPAYLNHHIEYGCTLKVVEISKIYGDGKMDVKTQGDRVFRIIKFYNPTFGKLYAAGKVEYLQNIENSDYVLKEKVRAMVYDILLKMNIKKDVRLKEDFSAYDVAHIVGMPLKSKYHLLMIDNEKDRQEYLIDHLERLETMIEGMEETKLRINMNGHYKNFDPLNF